MNLRPYQLACIDAIGRAGVGSHLIHMATATGKTLTMGEALTKHHPHDRIMWVAHHDELIQQAIAQTPYNVFCETIQSAHTRIDRYGTVDVLVIDEAHHATANTYVKLIEGLKPHTIYGLTATPNRADGVGLERVFDDIIFEYNVVQGIKEGYLSHPIIKQVKTRVDISHVRRAMGDYVASDLRRVLDVDSRNKLICDAVAENMKPCIVFAIDVKHAENLAAMIPKSICITGKTKNRAELLASDWKVLINVEVATEGIDIPKLRTVILARPTQSPVLMIQMIGRGMRWLMEKPDFLVVDFVDVTKRFPPCSPATLLGLEPLHPKLYRYNIDGKLLDVSKAMDMAYQSPEAIVNSEIILKDWASKMGIATRQIIWTRRPNGGLALDIGRAKFIIDPPDSLGLFNFQARIDAVYAELCSNYGDLRQLWHQPSSRKWRGEEMTDRQRGFIKMLAPEFLRVPMDRGQASKVITHLKHRRA